MGKAVRCSHCGGQETRRGIAGLRTGFGKPFWTLRQHMYTMFECADCGHAMFFLPGSLLAEAEPPIRA